MRPHCTSFILQDLLEVVGSTRMKIPALRKKRGLTCMKIFSTSEDILRLLAKSIHIIFISQRYSVIKI
jgi:hypothetical protein